MKNIVFPCVFVTTRMISPSYWIFLVLCLVTCLSYNTVEGCSIRVDPNSANSTNSTSCWQGGAPCGTVELGLRGLQQHSNATLCIAPISGGYRIMGNNNTFVFENMSDIAIVGTSANNDSVIVNCVGEAGLTFRYTRNITIQSVNLTGCGTLQLSTSKNLGMGTQFEFAYFYATLYFLYCEDVRLKYITVSKSNGIGAVFYSSVGTNTIDSSYFTDNTVHPTYVDKYPGGGGLYIEFSYCTPGPNISDPTDKNNCTVTNVHPDLHDVKYEITNSHFSGNNGSIVNTTEHTFILPQNETHLAFGRGGGVSVFFKGNAHNNTVSVINCTISDNTALWGAGLFVEFQDMTNENQIFVNSSNISCNQVLNYSSSKSGTGGGGARVGYIFFDQTHSHNNLISFNNVSFESNKAYFGGGLSFYVSRENTSVATNRLQFVNCTWESNTARVGTAVDLSVWHPVPEGAAVKPSFSNCTFTSNNANYTLKEVASLNGTFVGLGAVYSDSIPVLFKDQIMFSDNTHTALAAVSTGIFFDENVIVNFHNNKGRNGGALALMGYAFIEVSENAMLNFTNNSAALKGGAIYGHSIGEHDLISSRNCFIRYKNISATPYNWNARFYFHNNTARDKNNSIYVTSLLTCLWGGAFSTDNALSTDVFCWNDDTHPTRWVYSPCSCNESIKTSPAQFIPQNRIDAPTYATNNSQTDESPYNLPVIPGKKRDLPFTTQDDTGNNVTEDTVFIAQLVQNDEGSISLESKVVYISDNKIELNGNIGDNGTLKIETIDPRVIYTQVSVTIQDCPLGMVFESNSCQCKGTSYNQLIKCNQHDYSTQIRRGAWIGKVPDVNNSVLVGQCPYCTAINTTQYISLSQNLCEQIDRTDTLCGRCKEGYGPAVNSENFICKNCTDEEMHLNWFFYLLSEFLPITIFFFIVIIFNISVTSGPANAFVFFAQMTTTALNLDGDGLIQVSDTVTEVKKLLHITPCDIWNLNFFHPYLPKFCLSPNITTLQLIATGYVTALYPLILIVIFSIFTKLYSSGFRPIVFIFRPLHACFVRVRRIWDVQKSIIHALATFLLLSYTKFTLVSFLLLNKTPLIDDSGKENLSVLYYDGTIKFASPQHLPYLFLAVIILLTFVAIPPIVLTVPSVIHLLQNCGARVPDMCGGALWNQFLSTFHGCYKDGTGGDNDKENRYDYRWFAGLYFILRVVLLAISAFTLDWVVQTVFQQFVCALAFAMFVILRPYKNDFYNKVDPIFMGGIVVLLTLSLQNYYFSIVESEMQWWTFFLQYLLLSLPLVYMSVIVIYHLWGRNKTLLTKILNRCLRKILKQENEEVVPNQTDDAFFQDAEVAGRFGGRDEDSLHRRPSVQSGESEPLLQNEQSPPHSSGSSRGSGNRQRRSNESQYGAAQISAGTQTPVSDFEEAGSSFGSAGIGKLHVVNELDEKEQKKSKSLFFTR